MSTARKPCAASVGKLDVMDYLSFDFDPDTYEGNLGAYNSDFTPKLFPLADPLNISSFLTNDTNLDDPTALDPVKIETLECVVSSTSSDDGSSQNWDDDEESVRKKEQKRERNRMAASKYRKKKKEKMKELESKIEIYSEEVARKSAEVSALETENHMLKQQISFLQGLLKSISDNPAIASGALALGVFLLFVFVVPIFTGQSGAEQLQTEMSFQGRRLFTLVLQEEDLLDNTIESTDSLFM